METQSLIDFFMWCTIINGGILIYATLFCALAPNWMYRMHGGLFGISREAFNVAIYSYLGLFKVFILIFCLVPYLALLIIR